ncbi:hypothetical protein TNCV_4299311 [Trichonephila clavipes]|nr:hypothetical protein TNCV_4299311 [Trichonephila clavipes]
MLKHVYGSDTVSLTKAFEWHRRYREVTWKPPQSPRKQKFHRDRSEGKVILKVFFYIQGIVNMEFLPAELYCEQRILHRHPALFVTETESGFITEDDTPSLSHYSA